MGMSESVISTAGFYVDDYVCAILTRAWDKTDDIFSYDKELQAMANAPDFFEKAAAGDLPEDFYEMGEIHSYLTSDRKICWANHASEFCGDINTMSADDEAENTGFCVSISDKDICWVDLQRSKSWFKAAYTSVDEMVQEIKETLGDIVQYFPNDFDWAKHICQISGTEFC